MIIAGMLLGGYLVFGAGAAGVAFLFLNGFPGGTDWKENLACVGIGLTWPVWLGALWYSLWKENR